MCCVIMFYIFWTRHWVVQRLDRIREVLLTRYGPEDLVGETRITVFHQPLLSRRKVSNAYLSALFVPCSDQSPGHIGRPPEDHISIRHRQFPS